MKKVIVLLSMTLLFLMSCSDDQVDIYKDLDQQLEQAIARYSPKGDKEFYILAQPHDFHLIPQDQKNRLSTTKVELGKFLFYETGIALDAKKSSGMGTYSCASCHIPEAGFRPGRVQGIADGGMGFGVNGEDRIMNSEYKEDELDIQSARPLSLLNVAYVRNTFWNGQFGATGVNVGTESVWNESDDTKRNHLGYEGLETQNIEGMKSHRFLVNKSLMEEFGYIDLFDKSFPEYNETYRYSNFTASLAISAYLRTLMTNEAPFQSWLQGNVDAMTVEEKQGALLFFGKANCNSCHYNKNLGSSEFHVLGVKDMDQNPSALNKKPNDRRNLGRGGFTLQEEDMFKFKVPGIYNMSDTPFYFHGSSKSSLRDLVEYKLNAQSENDRVDQSLISDKLEAISLSETEIDHLVLFLEKSLRDPHLERFQPDYIKSGLCYPNNDEISQIDLNCN